MIFSTWETKKLCTENNKLTVKQLAKKIGYHPQTIYKYFIKKYGMPIEQKRKHSRIMIDIEDFVSWWKTPKKNI